MIHPIRSKLIMLMAVCIFLLLGCRQVQPPLESEARQTILVADCVAQYYKTDGSAYVTQQEHQFTPGSGRLHVTATEPTGQVEYSLQHEQFSSPDRNASALSDLPESFFNQALATAVFYGMCAGGSLLDDQAMTSEEPVKIQGQWYKPFMPSWPKNQFSVTLLQNQDTSRFELVRISESSGLQWLAKNYNFRYNKELESRLPQTIDVFDIRDGIASEKLVVRFEYKSMSTTK